MRLSNVIRAEYESSLQRLGDVQQSGRSLASVMTEKNRRIIVLNFKWGSIV